MSIFWGIIEKIKNVYLPAYFRWLTERLSHTEPFMVLVIVLMFVFALVVYVWFRNRNA